MVLKKIIATAAAVLIAAGAGVCAASPTAAADTTAKAEKSGVYKYIPTFHGVMRAVYELSTAPSTEGRGGGSSRFFLRNARLSVGGFILPGVDYFMQADFCDRGSFKFLDGYIRLTPHRNLRIFAGQMRVPFSVEATRSPGALYFINRAFAARDLGNLRSVGVKAGYTLPTPAGEVYAEGGVFNSTDLSEQSRWQKGMTYSIKARLTAKSRAGVFTPEAAFMSRLPGGKGRGTRVNQWDLALGWKYDRWYVDCEVIGRHYTNSGRDDALGWSVFADYALPVEWWHFNTLSFQGRFDGMNDASNGKYDPESGLLATDFPSRRRITAGATLTYSLAKVRLDLRINYEQYFYASETAADAASPSDNSKLVAGAIICF